MLLCSPEPEKRALLGQRQQHCPKAPEPNRPCGCLTVEELNISSCLLLCSGHQIFVFHLHGDHIFSCGLLAAVPLSPLTWG